MNTIPGTIYGFKLLYLYHESNHDIVTNLHFYIVGRGTPEDINSFIACTIITGFMFNPNQYFKKYYKNLKFNAF